jgi:hypothetical protein
LSNRPGSPYDVLRLARGELQRADIRGFRRGEPMRIQAVDDLTVYDVLLAKCLR